MDISPTKIELPWVKESGIFSPQLGLELTLISLVFARGEDVSGLIIKSSIYEKGDN